MGAWDSGNFDNDDALDWVSDLENAEDLGIVRAALSSILEEEGEYLEAPECCIALAAAEVVAALSGKAAPKLPEDVANWVAAHPSLQDPALIGLAAQAVRKVLAGSELQELWDDADADPASPWRSTVKDLLRRLT